MSPNGKTHLFFVAMESSFFSILGRREDNASTKLSSIRIGISPAVLDTENNCFRYRSLPLPPHWKRGAAACSLSRLVFATLTDRTHAENPLANRPSRPLSRLLPPCA